MNKFIFWISILLILSLFIGCTSKPEESEVPPEVRVPVESVVEQVVPQLEPEPKLEPEPVQDAEYLRSIAAISGTEVVTVDTFNQDKKAILEMIDEIEVVMTTGNYQKWLNYVEPNSIKYWQNRANLKSIEERLPVKVKISSMQDYFKYIFIPARTGRTVDEIRYVSSTVAKAVQVQGDTDIIYYTFEKINDKWMLKLDTLF
ncbi:MAG: hypothetical protein J6B32_00875 [Spirochaetaceae bacterium]|nr:hypothetical protein [Spirochaetaceae bacterium]